MMTETKVKAELSKKNPYWIEKHRYHELKHFCLQYPIWRKIYNSFDSLSKIPDGLLAVVKNRDPGDPTGKCAEIRAYYLEHMKLVEQTANAADPELADYILKGVTEGWPYDILKLRLNIPCCKDVYYNLYRRFFWLLSQARG